MDISICGIGSQSVIHHSQEALPVAIANKREDVCLRLKDAKDEAGHDTDFDVLMT